MSTDSKCTIGSLVEQTESLYKNKPDIVKAAHRMVQSLYRELDEQLAVKRIDLKLNELKEAYADHPEDIKVLLDRAELVRSELEEGVLAWLRR